MSFLHIPTYIKEFVLRFLFLEEIVKIHFFPSLYTRFCMLHRVQKRVQISLFCKKNLESHGPDLFRQP